VAQAVRPDARAGDTCAFARLLHDVVQARDGERSALLIEEDVLDA
jgi:hypothetical protein